MKKHSLDLFLKKTKVVWKRNIIKNIKLKLRILAGAAIKKPPVSTALTILGVNIETFINNFNNKTADIYGIEEVVLPTIITVTPAKTANFIWKNPTTYALYQKIFQNKNWDKKISEELQKKISARASYKLAVATIKKKKMRKQAIQGKMRQIYGTVNTWDIYHLADHSKDKKRQKKKK